MLTSGYDHGNIGIKNNNTNPEEENKMTMVILAVIGMVIAMVVMAMEDNSKKEVTVEKAMVAQASEIAMVLAQLDRLNGKAGN